MADTHTEVAKDTTRRYEIVVRGAIDATLMAALACPTIVSDDDLTRIGVTVADQAQLFAILRQFFTAGIELVSLNQSSNAEGPASTR